MKKELIINYCDESGKSPCHLYCELLNSNTQQAQRYIDNYKNSAMRNLEDAYNNCSSSKYRVWCKWCKIISGIEDSQCNCLSTTYIASKNCNVFTIGFYYKTLGQLYLIYITPLNIYAIKLDNLRLALK